MDAFRFREARRIVSTQRPYIDEASTACGALLRVQEEQDTTESD